MIRSCFSKNMYVFDLRRRPSTSKITYNKLSTSHFELILLVTCIKCEYCRPFFSIGGCRLDTRRSMMMMGETSDVDSSHLSATKWETHILGVELYSIRHTYNRRYLGKLPRRERGHLLWRRPGKTRQLFNFWNKTIFKWTLSDWVGCQRNELMMK